MKDAGFHGLWIAGIIITIAGFATGYPLIGGVALAMLVRMMACQSSDAPAELWRTSFPLASLGYS